ncbi:hypothetical protein [Aurantiacibacter odishensis]|uniref:hypothetical protein n=1 Tax=Aurantiacibacter odishensis TaxID=1155476 RepID=UPI0013C49C2F|nr:hypothetical protein [Aurantiacibacter odishensis]
MLRDVLRACAVVTAISKGLANRDDTLAPLLLPGLDFGFCDRAGGLCGGLAVRRFAACSKSQGNCSNGDETAFLSYTTP